MTKKKMHALLISVSKKNEQKIESIVSKIDLFCGASLKKIREELNIDLLDIHRRRK